MRGPPCRSRSARAWACDLPDRLDIPVRLFPEVAPPRTVLGSAEDGSKVVAVATHDTGSAVAAAPFVRPGSIFLSVGTWSLVGVELDEPLINDQTFEVNLTNEGGVAGTTRLLRNVTGLWLLDECRRAWGEENSFDELVEFARSAPAFGPL